ncbi:MAG: lysine 2,3-aminomutase [Anaerosomatales bacterium]|nr:lysine 2,3-aminomutase [Anaerosomatales bacterium]
MNVNETRLEAVAPRLEGADDPARWRDWRWQLRNSLTSLGDVERALGIEFDEAERVLLEDTVRHFPMSVTPYYLSLIDVDDYRNDPVFRQALPSTEEIIVRDHDMKDPLAEDADSPVALITHRYPDRVLFRVANTCSMYCRHCTRKRTVGDTGCAPTSEELGAALDYIRSTPAVRDVLLSGGDPLMLSDARLDEILSELDAIEHVEVVRLGTRMPAVLPYRITDELCEVLTRHQPLWLNTHFNHPAELTPDAEEALARLADAGIPLGNQTVLLAGVNDCSRIMLRLVHRLVANRVRPYYLYQCDLSEGLSHFRTPVGKGIEIIESLIGHTSGFAVPTYVIDAPHGGGKIPVMPNYIVSWASDRVVLRNYEGVICAYREPDDYKRAACTEECDDCDRSVGRSCPETGPGGVAGLMRECDQADSLVPDTNVRYQRRENGSADG